MALIPAQSNSRFRLDRFVAPTPALDLLMANLRSLFLRELKVPLPRQRIELVLREAAAHSALTETPELWFPELAREKLAEAEAWAVRQQQLRGAPPISFAA